MKYLGIVSSAMQDNTIKQIGAGEKIDRKLPGSNLFLKGQLVNESSISSLKVVFYSPRHEIQEIIIEPNESIEFINQPCDRLQIETVGQDTIGQVSYFFQTIQPDTEEEIISLLQYSNIKKKQTEDQLFFYPELSASLPNRILGDHFRRRTLNLTDYPVLYVVDQKDGSAEINEQSSLVITGTPQLGAENYASVLAAQTSIHNSYFDQLSQIVKIETEIIIYPISNAQGYECGAFWSRQADPWNTITAGIKKFGIYRKPFENDWFLHVDNLKGAAEEVDTGLNIGQNSLILVRWLWDKGDLVCSIFTVDNTPLFTHKFTDFGLGPDESLFLNLYSRLDREYQVEEPPGIGSYGWSVTSR